MKSASFHWLRKASRAVTSQSEKACEDLFVSPLTPAVLSGFAVPELK